MARSRKKGPYTAYHLQEKIRRFNETGEKSTITTRSRRSTITPDMIGHTFLVHNGRKFTPLYVDENCVGYKFGEFSVTRTYKGHTSKKKK